MAEQHMVDEEWKGSLLLLSTVTRAALGGAPERQVDQEI